MPAEGANSSLRAYRGVMSKKDDADEVFRISAAGRSLTDDVSLRTRRYLISMAVRTLCFLGCVISFLVFKNEVIGWILLVGTLILPYIAVVVANGGRERPRELPTTTLMEPQQGLPPAEQS